MKTLAAALIAATMLTAPAVAQITLSVCDKEGCDVGKTGVYSPPSPRPLANPVAGDEWISNGHRWKRLGDRDVDLGELPHPAHPNITTCDSNNPSVCSSSGLIDPRINLVPTVSTVQVGTCQSLSPEAIKQIKDALR